MKRKLNKNKKNTVNIFIVFGMIMIILGLTFSFGLTNTKFIGTNTIKKAVIKINKKNIIVKNDIKQKN